MYSEYIQINGPVIKYIFNTTAMEEGRIAFKILTGKPIGKRTLRRPRHRWEDGIRMNLNEIDVNTWNLVGSAHDRNY